MNIASKVLTLMLFISMPVFAQECSVLNFLPTQIDGEDYVTVIAGHNDHYVEKYDSKKSVLGQKHSYYITPGVHTLVVEQWPLVLFKRLKRNNKTAQMKDKPKIYSLFMQLTAKANEKYQLEMINENRQAQNIRLNSVQEIKCDGNKESLLIAKEVRQPNISNDTLLPKSLEYRLRMLMNKIAGYHNETSSLGMRSNIIPAKLNSIIGTMLENGYVDSGNAIKVLTVLPYSLASKLQLFSGDEIIRLGKSYVRDGVGTPNQQLAEYFSSLYFGDKIELGVLRDKESMDLQGTYRLMVVPEVTYQIFDEIDDEKTLPELVGNLPLPAITSFEFDQLAIELDDYFKSKGVKGSSVEIKRDESTDKAFGLSGEKAHLSEKIALKVLDVKSGSIAALIGLKRQDIIVNINNTNLSEVNIDSQVNSLRNLDEGSLLSFIVLREGALVELATTYSANKLVPFSLTIDLNSVNIVNNTVDELQKKYRKHNYIEKRRGNYNRHHWTYRSTGSHKFNMNESRPTVSRK